MTREITQQEPGLGRLGRYDLLNEVASSPFATVFVGRTTDAKGFARLVTIKRPHYRLVHQERALTTAFLKEAQLAAEIYHPNILPTLEIVDRGNLYIVMEYVEGEQLEGLLRHAAASGHPIPPTIALRITLDILAGLHAAHELHDQNRQPVGLVHGGVTPQSVMIGNDGVARVGDFGLAKATAHFAAVQGELQSNHGAYRAPEQNRRAGVDRRADIFAVGTLVWEMLTSRQYAALHGGMNEASPSVSLPRLRDHAPGLPSALEVAVMRSLEIDPTYRFATAAEFAGMIDRACKVFGGAASALVVAAYVQHATSGLAEERELAQSNPKRPTVLAAAPSRASSRVIRKVQSESESEGKTTIIAASAIKPRPHRATTPLPLLPSRQTLRPRSITPQPQSAPDSVLVLEEDSVPAISDSAVSMEQPTPPSPPPLMDPPPSIESRLSSSDLMSADMLMLESTPVDSVRFKTLPAIDSLPPRRHNRGPLAGLVSVLLVGGSITAWQLFGQAPRSPETSSSSSPTPTPTPSAERPAQPAPPTLPSSSQVPVEPKATPPLAPTVRAPPTDHTIAEPTPSEDPEHSDRAVRRRTRSRRAALAAAIAAAAAEEASTAAAVPSVPSEAAATSPGTEAPAPEEPPPPLPPSPYRENQPGPAETGTTHEASPTQRAPTPLNPTIP